MTGGGLVFGDGIVGKLTGLLSGELDRYYLLLSMAPSFVGILTRGSLGWISVHPLGPGKSQVRSGAIGLKSMVEGNSDSAGFTQAFFEEDRFICERVHAGMTATKGSGGKLVDMERVVTDFHQFLATRLFDLPPTEFFEAHVEATN